MLLPDLAAALGQDWLRPLEGLIRTHEHSSSTSRCMPNVTSVTMTLSVNETGVELTNDAGCPMIAAGTTIATTDSTSHRDESTRRAAELAARAGRARCGSQCGVA